MQMNFNRRIAPLSSADSISNEAETQGVVVATTGFAPGERQPYEDLRRSGVGTHLALLPVVVGS